MDGIRGAWFGSMLGGGDGGIEGRPGCDMTLQETRAVAKPLGLDKTRAVGFTAQKGSLLTLPDILPREP